MPPSTSPANVPTRKSRTPLFQSLANAADALVLLPRLNTGNPVSAPELRNAPDGREYALGAVELLSLVETGLSAKELEKFFNADMAQAVEAGDPLEPDLDEDEDEDEGGMARHANDLHLNGRFDNPFGLCFHGDHSLSACLFARDIQTQQLVGFVKFSISYLAREADAYHLNTAQKRLNAALSLHFTVNFDLLYVCHALRGAGIGHLFIELIADLYFEILEGFDEQLKPTMSRYRKQFHLLPILVSEAVSQAGKSAHFALRDELDAMTETFLYYIESGRRKYTLAAHLPEDYNGNF